MNLDKAMVIVGGGQCGARAAHALRLNGWGGPITLIGKERRLPYERPPLSKGVLLGEWDASQCEIYGEAFYREQGIDVIVDSAVVAIDRQKQFARLGDGRSIAYSRLLLATGAAPRTLAVSGHDLPGIHVLRTDVDANEIARELLPGRRIVVIGAGFIGLEVAAAAVRKGCSLTVVEAAPRALMRAVPACVSDLIVNMHRAMGVEVRFDVQLRRFVGDSRISGVELADGETVPCDLAIVGVGVQPCVDLAAACGLPVDNGVVTDVTLRTADPAIFAAGDVCSFEHPLFNRRVRLECWKNAEDQARMAASNMLGGDEESRFVPWFWSDQYDITIQIAGLPSLGSTTIVRETGATSRVFFALSSDGVLVGASGIGTTGEIAKDIRIAQDLIAKQARPSPATLADRTVKLRSLLVAEAQ
ncbi:FAD-dependent pyridine nucleotide-disulfide oxidoreductase [Caballeronia hypogeia]|uniref:FAD-dependent pyridine nucleotide-disulfide oxidoreductase n=1 Tax=Caballeronia hypogeia TaxID=1777140 RepID=A0A158DHX7_9BURK|nr:FAD-dependent oxidoreductase [Caballeronia hypogeia]SAK94010.1 FAD-dependent pyridine nucleotide-disulfide oxidoreductase [Caballeronia hypogeia]